MFLEKKPLDGMKDFFRSKTIEEVREVSERGGLARRLTWLDLVFLGIGAIIGAGIFSVIGSAVGGGGGRPPTGPSVIISFILTGLACIFPALSYSYLGRQMPSSGSAYSFAYVAMGEIIAWIIGWNLLLEFAVGNIPVAISWSDYLTGMLKRAGILIPEYLTSNYDTIKLISSTDIIPRFMGIPVAIDVPAMLIVAGVSMIILIGIKESAIVNNILVAIKLFVIVGFIVGGILFVSTDNYREFAPGGWHGISSAAAILFFAYIGFDTVASASEEARRPHIDIPIGITGSLLICTIIYILVAIVYVGLVPPDKWSEAGMSGEPLALAIQYGAPQLHPLMAIIGIGALISTTTVLLVFQIAIPRLLYRMSVDGFLPGFFSRIHPRFRTPVWSTIISGGIIAVLAGTTSLDKMVELTNIGTLFIFAVTSAGAFLLAIKQKKWTYIVCGIMGTISCLYLMLNIPLETWFNFLGWLWLGISIYAGYGYIRISKRNNAYSERCLRNAASLLIIVSLANAITSITIKSLYPESFSYSFFVIPMVASSVIMPAYLIFLDKKVVLIPSLINLALGIISIFLIG